MSASTPETISNSPAAVNSGAACGPIRVTAASTTRRGNGDVVLFVRTEAGPGVLLFSPSLAKQLFVVTNPQVPDARPTPVAVSTPAVVASVAAPVAPPPPAPQKLKAPRVMRPLEERRALYAKLCAEIATFHGAHGAVSRVLRRHNITTAAFYSWRSEFGAPPLSS
ncbi:MAG: hypothetical protein KF715_08545 [Candidatus Didemnitutus sp.]|nr:hypothetical protein [Candidatus Didemnitutus sp.]